ncbi:SH3 domain-containing protein [Planctomycetota bacterium]
MSRRICAVFSFFCVLAFLLTPVFAGQSTSETFEYPFIGKVKATELNVRGGPSTKHAVLTQLKYGDTVTVMAARGEFFRIAPLESTKFFVASKYLFMTGDVTGEVTASVLNVRISPDLKHPPLGQLKRGDLVKVEADENGWTQILHPEGFGVWVSSKFVDYMQPVQPLASEEETEPDPKIELEVKARELFENADEMYLAECTKDIEQWDFTGVRAEFENILAITENEDLIGLVNSRLSLIDLRTKIKGQTIADLKSDEEQEIKLKEIEKKYVDLLAQHKRRQAELQRKETFQAVGWLHTAGRFMGRPSAWRLEKGRKILTYVDVPLNSKIKMDSFGPAYIGIKGDWIKRSGRDVLLAREITIIKK